MGVYRKDEKGTDLESFKVWDKIDLESFKVWEKSLLLSFAYLLEPWGNDILNDCLLSNFNERPFFSLT